MRVVKCCSCCLSLLLPISDDSLFGVLVSFLPVASLVDDDDDDDDKVVIVDDDTVKRLEDAVVENSFSFFRVRIRTCPRLNFHGRVK